MLRAKNKEQAPAAMTALVKFARLEASGLWRAAPGQQRREVIVSLGEASLVLSDGRTETALSHWSLPAVRRVNPGALPALYSPSPEGEAESETVEIEDADMIAAIETVRSAIDTRKPHPGRLRWGIFGGTLAVVLALGIFWLPGALVSHTAGVVPMAKRIEIGRLALDDVARFSGAPCTSRRGNAALVRLAERLFGNDGTRIVVLREGLAGAAHLPGRIILIGRPLVEAHDAPEVAAGHILAERLAAEARDPLIPALRWAGLRASFRLLTTGNLPEGAMAGYGERVLTRPAPPPEDMETLLARFITAHVASTPYALVLDPGGESTLPLIEADPQKRGQATAILPDEDWISLQSICAS